MPRHKPTLKHHSFEQPPKPFRLPEYLSLPELEPPAHTHKAMFTESKVKKFFTHAYADSGTDIHITNPATVLQLGLPRHTYATPVSIQPVRVQNQNPVEREVQTMIKAMGAILTDQYTLGASSWDYALSFWTKTHNSIPNTLTNKQSPHEIVTSQQPDASHFRFPFGCPVTATNVMGREGATYDVINEFGIAIGSNDSGN